jgi:glycosyltransferase involved in cell wall biosynthesis
MHRLYAAMDIFVLPSLNEGMPMTILEAMAAGCAIAASRVGAIPELIRDGESGRLFAPADRSGLATALIDLLEDEAVRKRIGAAARDRVCRDYSSSGMARKYVALYYQLLGDACAAA